MPSSGRGANRFAPLLCAGGAGVLLCSAGNAFARATVGPAMVLYIAGLLLIGLPIFLRLLGPDASAGERLALACLLGVSLYLVKVVRDAPSFTFSDELVHAFNLRQIQSHGELFRENSVLPVTPFYPGLEGAASALTSICGLSAYSAAVILVGVARLALVGGLFLLFERVGGSARSAGVAVAIYATNFNFLFWGAQFSYESLALPLLAVTLLALRERELASPPQLRQWAPPLIVAILAIVVTHHITSYVLLAVLVALTAALWYLRRSWGPPSPWPFAVLTALLVAAWLAFVAGETVSYLSKPLSEAFDAIGRTIAGESPPRGLFQGSADTGPTPLGARIVSLLGVLLLAVAVPFGLVRVWRRQRRDPFALLFIVAALGVFVALALRLAPAAWETGNRAGEFLFIGLAFVAAAAVARLRWPTPRTAPLLLTAGFGVLLVGGAISGWPWDMQLARPLRVEAAGRTISAPPLAAAEWARQSVPGGRFVAPNADANLLLVPGDKWVLSGSIPSVKQLLEDPDLAAWQLRILRENEVRYVVADRRRVASDGLRGYYFPLDDAGRAGRLLPPGAVEKYARLPGAARIYSNGSISVYDLRGRR
ncbi:MAG: hypothetical protein ACM3NV_04255 [Syntrophothermus sp.]